MRRGRSIQRWIDRPLVRRAPNASQSRTDRRQSRESSTVDPPNLSSPGTTPPRARLRCRPGDGTNFLVLRRAETIESPHSHTRPAHQVMYSWRHEHMTPQDDHLFQVSASESPLAVHRGQQLSLLGQPTSIRLPAKVWESWLGDPAVVARFEAKRYRRAEHLCWPWLNAVSSTGHGSFRAGSLPGRSRRGTVPAHLFAFQAVHGVIPRLGWSGAEDPVLCHRCDSHACENPRHLRLGTTAENRAEWVSRHRDPQGALADLRGPAGRARAIAAAIRAGLVVGDSAVQIEERIRAAEQEGLPLLLW